MMIRPEILADIEAIDDLTRRAFAPMPFSQGTEPAIIKALRAAKQLTLSLVAEHGGDIVGHIAFSPVTLNGESAAWFGLGPVSVLPEKQGQSIGSQLINAGLERLKKDGAMGCVLIGNPDYYSRFGFVNETDLTYGNVDRKFVQQLPFDSRLKKGILQYCDAFELAAAGS